MKRSDRVFDALHTLRNRYMLCQLASKATRKFHKPNTRIQETMNEVLERIASSERQGCWRNRNILLRHNGGLRNTGPAVLPRGEQVFPLE